MKFLSKLLACALLVLPVSVRAEDDPHAGHQMPMDQMDMDHGGMKHDAKPSAADASPSRKPTRRVNANMHKGMAIGVLRAIQTSISFVA